VTNSYTRTGSQTSTYTNIQYVTRKVHADLLAIQDLYNYFSEQYALDLITDVRHFLDEDVLSNVEFTWKQLRTTKVLYAYKYTVIAAGIGYGDDPPGGIRYEGTLATADFNVRISYNEKWKKMSMVEKKVVYEGLKLSWSTAGQLDYSGGKWLGSDHTYSKDDCALSRNRFSAL
jgi:Bacterial HORMA domain family 1